MRFDRSALLLYAVTDNTWAGYKGLAAQVEEALRGGVTCVQLREKDLDEDAFKEKAHQIKALCHAYGVPFIVNDHLGVTLACGADGIHVGQTDMQAKDVRRRIGDEMILGVSVQTVEQALQAQADGADYLGVGAVFSTATKADADSVHHQTLRDICSAVTIPVVAIGGINKHNILQLAKTGVDGVALVSAIFASNDIEAACKNLLTLSRQMVTA